MKKLKIGLAGTGFIADWHFRGFSVNPDAEITGMCRIPYRKAIAEDEKENLFLDKCSEWQVKAYESFESMVKDPGIDAVIIGSINAFHFEQIKIALKYRKPMLVEKPVVTDLSHWESIKEQCNATGVKLFPAHNFVYRTAVRQAKELLEQGKLGQIIHSSFISFHTISSGHANGWRAKKSLSEGGALMDSGHHLIYQALYLLGKPEKVQGFTSKIALLNMECEDTSQISLSFPDGSLASIMQTWASDQAGTINGIRIIGTKGSIVITDDLYFNHEPMKADTDYLSSFINQSHAFTDYILHDIPPVSGLEAVKDILEITHGAYASSESGMVVILG
jgi:predicted dehydrogenase